MTSIFPSIGSDSASSPSVSDARTSPIQSSSSSLSARVRGVVSSGITGVVSTVWTGSSILASKAKEGVSHAWEKTAVPRKIATICGLRLMNVGGMAGITGLLKSSGISCSKLHQYNPEFADCILSLSDQVAAVYVQNADGINAWLTGRFAWIFGLFVNKEVFAETIKANILNIIANLAEKAFHTDHAFVADGRVNPLGRLLSVFSACFNRYEERLNKIAHEPRDKRAEQYQRVFQELSADLLTTCFPRGAEDIQLTIPGMDFVKEEIWKLFMEMLPDLLANLYRETRPLIEQDENWKRNFDRTASGLKADELLHLPSHLFQHFFRDNEAQLLNPLAQVIENSLIEITPQRAEELSLLVIKYIKELFLTNDPSLKKIGVFLERYFMERILYNLSKCVPAGVETPVPLYVLQQWINGDVFKMLCAGLSGASLETDQKANAIRQFLTPFGLFEKAKFPLPPIIKTSAWSSIEGFIQDSLPDMILSIIPEWRALVVQKGNQSKLKRQLRDTSLTASVSHITSADQTFQLLTSSISLTNPGLHAQWQALLGEDHSIRTLKGFVQKCLGALSMQLCQDLYNQYDKSQMFFDEEDEREYMPPFSVWLFMEMAEACERLFLNGISRAELDHLQRAIHLKNTLRHQKDVEQARQDRAALDALWVTIKPKFDHLACTLLGMCGYRKAEDLPLPLEGLKTTVWDMLNLQLPYILFEQMGDLMLPLLEKQQLQERVDALPQGQLIRQGCEHLARDVVKHLPKWLKSTIDTLPQQLVTANVGLQLTDQAQSDLTATLNAILNKEDSAYLPFWQWMESYLQGFFLKVVVGMNKMSAPEFQRMHELVHQTKNELLVLKEASVADDDKRVKDTLVKFSEKLLALIGIEFPYHLFGMPQALQEPLLNLMKEKMAHGLLGVYQICHKSTPHPLEHRLPTSEVEKATHALTRYVLDRTTFQLIERDVDGNVKFIDQMYAPFKAWLRERSQEDYRVATLFQSAIDQQSLTPSLANLLDLIHSQSCKQEVTDWINPALANQVIKCFILPLLQKAEAGQATFDQTMLMALLPLLTQHLKHLNVASQSKKALNIESLSNAAGNELHPAVPLGQEEGEKQKQDRFYQGQARLIFQLIFPNGKRDAEKLLPSFVSDEQWNSLSTWSQECIASLLPNLIEVFFDKEMLTTIFSNLFEITIDTLDQPIQMSPIAEAPSPLTEEQQRQVNQSLGQFVIEAAQFIELPAGLVKRLGQEGVQEVIGKMVGKQLNGELLTYTIRRTLSILANKKYVKQTEQELLDGKLIEEKRLQELEKKLVQRSLAYVFRYVGAYVEHVTDIFKNPALNFLRKSLLVVTSFILVNILGTFLRVFRIEQFVVSRLSKMVRYRTERILTVMSQPDLYKNLVYHAIDAFESVLTNQRN